MATESGSYTPETVARRAKMAELLLADAMKPQKITHPLEGVAQMARALSAGYMSHQANQEANAGDKAQADALRGYIQSQSTISPAMSSPAPVAPTPAAPSPEDTPMSGPLPRGLRNNNPLNIEAGQFTQGVPGFSGSDGRFAKFASMDQGIGAANKLLDVYQNKHGLNTPAGIIGRWSPANDGNNVSSYAMNVAKALGINPNDPVPPEKRMALIAAMGQHENGRPIPMGNGGGMGGSPAPMAALPAQGAPASPMEAAPAAPPQQMAQAAPQAMAQAPTPQANDPRAKIAEMLNSPNPYVRRMGMQLGQKIAGELLKPNEFKPQVAGENLYSFDPRTGKAVVAGSATKPTYGVLNEDEYGKKNYGWIDPRNRSTTPGHGTPAPQSAAPTMPAPSAPPAAPVNVPAPPPGADPKTWRNTFTEAAAKKAQTEPERTKQEKLVADIVTTDIDRAIKTIDNATLPTTGMVGGFLSNIGGTAARDVAGLLDTVKANAGFQELSKMRQDSPTGGALGAITEKELALLQATIGNLEQSQTEAQLKDNMRRVKNTYLDIVHGPGKGPKRETLSFSEKKPASGKTKSGITWSVE